MTFDDASCNIYLSSLVILAVSVLDMQCVNRDRHTDKRCGIFTYSTLDGVSVNLRAWLHHWMHRLIHEKRDVTVAVNHGVQGERASMIWSGRRLWKLSPKFCNVSKFQAPDCLYYNAVKACQPQKYIFNINQITISGGKFNILFWRGHGL